MSCGPQEPRPPQSLLTVLWSQGLLWMKGRFPHAPPGDFSQRSPLLLEPSPQPTYHHNEEGLTDKVAHVTATCLWELGGSTEEKSTFFIKDLPATPSRVSFRK